MVLAHRRIEKCAIEEICNHSWCKFLAQDRHFMNFLFKEFIKFTDIVQSFFKSFKKTFEKTLTWLNAYRTGSVGING